MSHKLQQLEQRHHSQCETKIYKEYVNTIARLKTAYAYIRHPARSEIVLTQQRCGARTATVKLRAPLQLHTTEVEDEEEEFNQSPKKAFPGLESSLATPFVIFLSA